MEEDLRNMVTTGVQTFEEAVHGSSGSLVRSLVTLALLLFFGGVLFKHFFEYLLHYMDRVEHDPDQVPSFSSYLRSFVRETYYALAIGLAYPLGALPLFSARGGDSGGPPILLVHGYLMNRLSMAGLYFRLRRLGYQNVEATNLHPKIGSLEDISARLALDIRSLSQRCGGQPVVCIAHSMGGLALRQCVARDADLPVAKIISLGSPHHGTRMAILGIGTNALEMRPGSALLQALAPTPRVPLISFYSDLDAVVQPNKSSIYGDRTAEFQEVGHLTLLFDKKVFQAIAREVPSVRPTTS